MACDLVDAAGHRGLTPSTAPSSAMSTHLHQHSTLTMPSRSKNHSKSKSRLSKPPTLNPTSDLQKHDLLSCIPQASDKFPSFVIPPSHEESGGVKSAILGRVFDVKYDPQRCVVWLHAPSMNASNIDNFSTVSVSLLPRGCGTSSGFPLSSLTAECSEHFGIDSREDDVSVAGNYFVIATVCSSTQVPKDGVRLSSNLSNSLGRPAPGRVVCVSPVQIQTKMCHSSGDSNENSLLSYTCKQLYLKPLAFEINTEKGPMSSPPKAPSSTKELSLTEGLDGSSGADSGSLDVKEMFAPETKVEPVENTAESFLGARSLLLKNIVACPGLGKLFFFQVLRAEKLSNDSTKSVKEDSDAVFIIDRKTKVSICLPSDLVSEASEETIQHCNGINYKGRTLIINREVKKLGGLWKEYEILKSIISSLVKNDLSCLGLHPRKGVLLYGPSGTGKTSLAKLCAHDAGVNFFEVNGPEVISQYYGESERKLQKVFDAASNAAPAVIFIDELDAIAPARKEDSERLSQRMVATLLNLMDGISRNDRLLIIAATNRIEIVEPALRRPGRFDREIEIGVPSAEQRLDILKAHLDSVEHFLLPWEIQHLATVTHGFVGADLAALCNEAAMVCLRRYLTQKTSRNNVYQKGTNEKRCGNSSILVNGNILAGEEDILMLDLEDFEKAKLSVRPSAMREVMLEIPRVKWDDVGGQEEVKKQLMEAVVWPQKHSDAFKRIGTSPPTGVLMFGPPGCSKTLMARAVASEAGLNFLAVKGPELFNKWVGESEKAVKSLFAKARANAPSIIFFDEIDSLAVTREKASDGNSVAYGILGQLLVEMDGLHLRVNVTVIAATNRPDNIDPALLRPGRFDRLLYVGLPNEKDREGIFHIHSRKMPCSSDVDRRRLARLTEGFTGADISFICRAAAMKALEESFDAAEIKMEHFEAAIKNVHPTETEPYKNLLERFQRLVSSKAEGLSQSKQSMWCQSWRNPLRWILGRYSNSFAARFTMQVLGRGSSRPVKQVG